MQAPTSDLGQALEWELGPRLSLEAQVQYEITQSPPLKEGVATFDRVEQHYIESSNGRRFCDERYKLGDETRQHRTHYDDLTRCASVQYYELDPTRQSTVQIGRTYHMERAGDRMERPHPFQLLYVGREPLAKAFPKASKLGDGTVLGRDCGIYLFKGVQWVTPQDHVYWIDKVAAIPLKVEAFLDEASRNEERPAWTWTATSLDKVDGHYVPLTSTMVSPLEEPGDTITYRYEVKDVRFGKTYPASSFWPKLQPGVTVVDGIAEKHYQVPGGAPPPEPKVNVAVGAPRAEAIPPSDWTDSFPLLSLAFGTILVVVGGIYRIRSR